VTPGLLLLLAFAIFRMPPWLPLFVIESNGVDPSWQMLLNEAVPNGWTFGRDLFFTYGPFGFIHARMYHPETWEILVAVWLGISVIMADLIWRVVGHCRLSPMWRALCAVAMVELMSRDAMAVCFGLHAFVFLEAINAPEIENATDQQQASVLPPTSLVTWLRLCMPILLLATLPWAKFSYFVTVAFLGCTLTAAGLIQRRFPWRPVVLLAACPFVWLMAGGTLAECREFIGAGLQLAGGYSAAMGLGPETLAGVIVAASAASIVVVLPAWLSARLAPGDWRLRVVTILFLQGLLFITWKSSFVRYHAERLPVFLGTVLPLLAYGWLASGGRQSSKCATGSASANEGKMLSAVQNWQSQRHTFGTKLCSAYYRCSLSVLLVAFAVLISAGTVERVRRLALGAVIGHATAPLRDQILAVAESVKNPGWRAHTHQKQLQKIRDANPIPDIVGTVDIFPSKLIVGFAHGLQLQPRPLLQSYAAFTPALIERDAEFYRGPAAPENILISVAAIDGRLPTLEDSHAWFELLSNYELTDSSTAFLKLSRRPRPSLLLDDKPVLRKSVRWNEPVELPRDLAGPVWCRIQIKPSLPGRLASILYRLPEIHLKTQVGHDRNDDRTFRLLPGSTEAGFLISPTVETRDNLVRLWQWADKPGQCDVDLEHRVRSLSGSVEMSGELKHFSERMFAPKFTIEFFGLSKNDRQLRDSDRSNNMATSGLHRIE